MERYVLERVYLFDKFGNPVETLGSIYDLSRNIICKTMELPWRNNQKDDPNTPINEASCIPEGLYIFEKQAPGTFGRYYGYFRARAIQGRTINKSALDANKKPMSSILMHRITYVKDLLGCIGIGSRFFDFNKDGWPDMAESGKKLEWMYQNMPDVFELEIKKKPK